MLETNIHQITSKTPKNHASNHPKQQGHPTSRPDQSISQSNKKDYIARLLHKNIRHKQQNQQNQHSIDRSLLPEPTSHQNIHIKSRKISPSLINRPKNKNHNHPKWQSQEFNPSKTMQINKLKLEITDYLNKKAVSSPTNDIIWPQFPHSAREKQENYHNIINEGSYRKKKLSAQKNLYLEKKELRQTKLLEYRRRMKEEQEEEDVGSLHRKSFTIKQLKPQKKQATTSDPYIFEPRYGKFYGSYYQIVAVQKKFQNSQYWGWGPRGPALLGQKSNDLSARYQSRITNPEKNGISPKTRTNQLRGLNIYEGGVLQPWKNHDNESNLLETGGFNDPINHS